jgi:hypothetical protein
MKNFVGKIVLLLLIVFSISACTSQLAYKKNSGDPTSPGDNEMVFGLRNSTILISTPPEKKSGDNTVSDKKTRDNNVGNTCNKSYKDVLKKCLSGVIVDPVPSLDTPSFYIAQWKRGTTLSEFNTINTSPLMLESFSVNYKNPAPGIITAAGTGATAGFAIGGPWGAVIGGLVGAISKGMDTEKSEPINALFQIDELFPAACPKDKVYVKDLKTLMGKSAELYLPLTISKGIPDKPDEQKCWHPLPNRSPKAEDAMENHDKRTLSGWFYRILVRETPDIKFPPVLPDNLDSISPPFQKNSDYFATTDPETFTKDKTTFPVSACRAVELQITWWEKLDEAVKANAEPKLFKYSLMVADSNYVQVIRLPKEGSILLLPVCGGYASPKPTSSSAGEVFNAVVQQAQAIKAAQEKYEK